jgi:hypothetical protein
MKNGLTRNLRKNFAPMGKLFPMQVSGRLEPNHVDWTFYSRKPPPDGPKVMVLQLFSLAAEACQTGIHVANPPPKIKRIQPESAVALRNTIMKQTVWVH